MIKCLLSNGQLNPYPVEGKTNKSIKYGNYS